MKNHRLWISNWLALAVALGMFLAAGTAEARQGRAIVRSIIGLADFDADGSGVWKELKVGKVLRQGAIIRTGEGSRVLLFLSRNGPVIQLAESTELELEHLSFEIDRVETVIDTRLNLKSGRVRGMVDKLAESSRYEIVTPDTTTEIVCSEYEIHTGVNDYDTWTKTFMNPGITDLRVEPIICILPYPPPQPTIFDHGLLKRVRTGSARLP